MEELINSILKAVIEAILVTGILGYFFLKREETLKRSIEEEFKKRERFFDTRFNHKLRALEELLAPIKLQLIRSNITIQGYDANNEFRENILKECNENIRKLLLEKGYLIPADLMSHAEKFIKHYDEWLQAYKEIREIKNDTSVKHVFVYSFPHDAEDAFVEKYEVYRKELEIEGSLN